ncbi:MAG: ABC transporter ATP-binding protein [Gemmataceae bacterium]|nr:ABC transporter ATP-binding protein [Gemmataceae bacterium]
MDPALLDLHHVSRTFGPLTALDDVSLNVPPGRLGLLGPNGAGKSTLLKLLMGLLPPTTGSGTVLGQPLGCWRLRQMVGFMPEADALVPGLQGVEYVALAGELYGMPRSQARRRAHEVLTYLELEDARYRKLEEYSTGMKQRIKLAQSLIHDPPALLLDEPTSGLDPAGRDAMLRLLLKLGRDHGKSLILCTHLLADVEQVCDQVVILDRGKVCRQGTVAELCTTRKDRYRLQVQGDPAGFLVGCEAAGVDVLTNNGRGEYRLTAPPGWTPQSLFSLADRHGTAVRSLTRDDETLEEMFHRVISHDQ